MALRAVSGITRGQALALLPAGYTSGRLAGDILPAPAVFTRAQAGGARSTALGADGVTWGVFGADVPRFGGTARRLLQGVQRTNAVTNPAAEGLTPGRLGAGGALPTGWTTGTITGMTIDVAAAVENGLPAVDLTITPTGAGAARVTFETVSATPGVVSTLSLFARLVAGPIPASVTALLARTVDLPSGNLSPSTSMLAMTGAALSSQRWFVTRAADATATQGRHEIAVATSGAGSAFTIRVALPDIESGAPFASTPIPAPPPGGPYAPRTREADRWSAPLSALRIPENGACTVLMRARFSSAASGDPSQLLFQIDNNTGVNRFGVGRIGGTANRLRAYRQTAGAFAGGTTSTVVLAAGVEAPVGLSFDGAGRAALSVAGEAPVDVTGAPTSGFLTARWGSDAAGFNNMFGAIQSIQVIPRAISDAELQARVANF